MDYMQEDEPPAVTSGSTLGLDPASSSSSSPSTWRAPERKRGNMKQTRRLDDMMDLEQNSMASASSSTLTGEHAKQGKGKSAARGGNGVDPNDNNNMDIERERPYTSFPSSLSFSLPNSGVASSSLANAMNPATSTVPGTRHRGHLRGASRSHVVPVYNNDPTGSRGTVPLPASTGGTINTTLNKNGTVTVTRSAPTPTRNQGRRNIGSSSSSPFTSTDSQNPETSGGQDGIPGGFDLKGLMSPPTPAPSPTPGRVGWWGTVARDAGEGDRPGNANWGEVMNAFDPAQLLLAFPSLPPPTRLRLLEDLLPLLSTPELLMLSSNIGPRLKRDFLKELPTELALHVLSFIDDPMTLARASLVSKHWYRLLQDEKTWKNMCARHRFQTAEILPAIPALTQRNASDVAILSRNRSGSSEAMVIPSSTNTITPQFEVTNPRMFSASRVGRNDGLVYGPDVEEEDPHHGYPVILPEHAPMQFDVQPHVTAAYPSADQTMIQEGLGSVVSPRRRNVGLAQQESETQSMPGAYHVTSTPSSSAMTTAQQAHYTGQINGQLPPMPSIISPSAVANTGFQNHFGLGLNTGDARTAQQSASGLPFTSMSPSSRGLGTIDDMEMDQQHDDVQNGILTSAGMLASTSSMSGLGRSHSVPEPILLQNRRPPSYGTKKPEEVDTEAPGFSYKNHFKKAYLTESNWLRGGRLLSTHTSTDEGVVTTLAMNAKYIIIGMANTRIHLFEADRGKFIRSFDGHDLGVWALYLVTSGVPPADAFDSDDAEWDGESSFNIGSYTRERDVSNRQKPRKRPRSDTRRASLGESSYSAARNSQSSHIRNGSSSQSNRPGQRHLPGSYDPNGPFGPRYPGTEGSGKRLQSSDVASSAYGWGQKKELVISGGCDRDVKVWDIATGECLHTMHGHTSTIRCLKVLDGRPVAVTGARDATIRVWDIERGVLLHNLTGHTHSVRCMEIAGHYCVSGSYDCTARIWDLETGECLQVLRGHYHQIYDVAFDGEKVATGSLDSTVRVWSAATGECIALLQGHTSLVGQLQLSGDILVTGGSDGRVIIFDLSTYTCLQRICAHDNSVTSLQFDDRFILSGGNDGRVKLWDIKTGNFIRELSKPSEAVWKVTFKNDKCAVLCKRNNKTVLELLSFVPEEFSI